MLLACLAALVFCGCNKEIQSGSLGSEKWDGDTRLTFGDMNAQKLEPLPWNSGRLEATSDHRMVESENGYYLNWQGRLYYADKSAMKWVLVCGKADCDHFSVDCNSLMNNIWIAAKDGRLYFPERTGKSLLSGSPGIGIILVSADAAADDKKPALVFEEGISNAESSSSNILHNGAWLYTKSVLDEHGNRKSKLFAASEEGSWVLELPDNKAVSALCPSSFLGLYGDEHFIWYSRSETHLLQFRDGEIVETVPYEAIPELGGCLSGNVVRTFAINDGYYDVDTKTGERVRVGDAQFANSYSAVVAPNCILESTKLTIAAAKNTRCGLALFDGESWRIVKLPPELENMEASQMLIFYGIASDRILMACSQTGRPAQDMYQILLGEEDLTMEYCGTVEKPIDEEETETTEQGA